MEIKLRKASIQDKPEIVRIASFLYIEMPNFVWNDDNFVSKQIGRESYYVAELQGKIVGIISLRQRRNKMYIETLAVDEKYRQQGVSSSLLEFAKKYTKENGLNILFACSFFEYNAVDFYLKQGFVMLPVKGKYSGHQYHCFEMKID